MKHFEISTGDETYKIIPNSDNNQTFDVINYATRHTIKRNGSGLWIHVEHKFGKDSIPIKEIGEAIELHYSVKSSLNDLKDK